MAAYPSFPQLATSEEEFVDDIALDRAVNGGVRSRAFYTAKKRRFTVRHLMSATDQTTLATFYDTNRLLSVTFVWTGDGATYTCLFEGPPKVQRLGAQRAQVEVRLSER